MTRIGIAGFVALLLCFAGFSYAQEPQQEPRTRPEQTRPEPRPEVNPPNQEPRQEQSRPAKPERQENPKPPKESRPSHEQQGENAEPGHARPAGKSAHIPDPKFRESFGRPHPFRANQVIDRTVIVPGQTQFVYSGYTFIILDPWPTDWLFTDDCYIDSMDDDYFLFDMFHPGVRVALFVVG